MQWLVKMSLVADLSGPLVRPIQQSGGTGPALTLPPGHIAYGIIEPSIVPTSVMNVLQNPMFMVVAAMVVFFVLR